MSASKIASSQFNRVSKMSEEKLRIIRNLSDDDEDIDE